MKTIRTLLSVVCLSLLPLSPTLGQESTPKGTTMTVAKGTFEVKIADTGHAPDPSLGSRSLDKTYHGDLEATAKGEMLSAGDPATGNAGYVAIERVTGTLGGHTGTFAIMQAGTMTTGTPPQLTATIVPGSGTGDFSGIYGTLTIVVANGKHLYDLSYALSKK